MEILKKYHPIAPLLLAELTGVDTPDEMTAVLRLANPAPYLMKGLAGRDLPIMCKSVFEGTPILQNPTANKPIGTGPFKFGQWDRGQFVRLDRNDKYWKPGLPYLDHIIARFIPDAATRSAAIETGEAHFAGYSAVNYADLARMKTNPILDTTMKLRDDARLERARTQCQTPAARQERSAAGHRLCDRSQGDPARCHVWLWPAGHRPAQQPLRNRWFYTDDVRNYDVPDRLDIANKLLDGVGLPRGPNGMRFAIHLEVNSFGEQWLRQAEYLKQALAIRRDRSDTTLEDTHLVAARLTRLRLLHQRALPKPGRRSGLWSQQDISRRRSARA